MTDRMDNISQVVDRFVNREDRLEKALREALEAATSGQIASRAYRVQMILEDALGESDDR